MSDTPVREFVPVATSRKAARWWLAGSLALLALLLAWMGGGYLWPGILRYEVTTEYFIITTGRHLVFDVTKIPLARINEISGVILRNGALRFGKEKPGYCVGYFYLPTQGEIYLATNCGDRGVLVRGSGQTTSVAVSPAEPDKLIFALRNHQPGVFAPPPREFASYAGWLALYLLLFLVGSGVLLTTFVIAPARLRYVVRPGELEIRGLGRPTRVPLAGAKVRRHRPLLGGRKSGVVLPGYIVGSFLYDSAATSVFAAAKEEGVLYEGEGRIFMTPNDIDGFLAALEAAGAERVVTKLQLWR